MSSSSRDPSAAETLAHAAYPGTFWALEPDRQGRLPVAKGRGGPVEIAWEIHGDGPIKIALVMGLAGITALWQWQTLHFGHDGRDRFSVLVFDNRGAGASDKPLLRYSTSEMAADAVELLDHVGWTAPRSVHLVGISLGGMIAQEMACAVPTRLQSLSLLATTAHVQGDGAPALQVAKRIAMLALPGYEDWAVADTTRRVFAPDWLAAPDDATLPDPARTPRCSPPSGAAAATAAYARFESNFQRCQAQELTKRRDGRSFSVPGYLCQLMAALGHRKSDEQLRAMADAVGRRRILIVHGTADAVLPARNGRHLVDVMEPADGVMLEGAGHGFIMERARWFNKLFEQRLEEWSRLGNRERHDSVMQDD